MAVLTKAKILQEMEAGNIVIDPAPVKIGPNSIDLRLASKLLVYLPHNYTPNNYTPILDVKSKNETYEIIIPERGWTLYPGTLYLGSTYEYTETWGYVPYLDGRSSAGRLGISIHCTAGRGDVGFCGNWTMEISVTHPVIIYPLIPIAQITYHTVYGEIVEEYKGRYQGDRSAQASRLYLGE